MKSTGSEEMKEVYLDNSATTMAYRSVGELVQKVMCEDYGNPSSMHNKGVEAEKYIKEAKETFARLWKVQEKEVYFTSGGTESDNMALIGAARANKRAGNHLITSSIEHPAIINTMRFLEEEKVAVVPGSAFGESGEGFLRVSYAYSLEDLKEAIGRLSRFVERLRSQK
jgi:cysteine desulfurase